MLDTVLEIYFWHFWQESAGFNRGVWIYLKHYLKQKYAIFLLGETRFSCQDEFSLHGKHFITITP